MRHTLLLLVLAPVVQVACARATPPRLNPYASAAVDCVSPATLVRREGKATPNMAPPLWRVRACPTTAGIHLAALLDTSRTLSDTAELERRTWLSQYVHDAKILRAALAVAGDGSAHQAARVAALRTLIWMKSPGHHITLHQMASMPSCPPERCTSTYEGHFYGGGPMLGDTTTWPVYGAPMPPKYPLLIDSLAHALIAEPKAPQVVRQAAGLVLRYPPATGRLQGR